MLKGRAGLLAVVALSLPVAAAGAQGSGPMSCASAPAHQMAAFDTTRVGDLVGAFDILMIDTTSIRGSARQHVGKLALWLQDSVPRRGRSTARRTQKQFLV